MCSQSTIETFQASSLKHPLGLHHANHHVFPISYVEYYPHGCHLKGRATMQWDACSANKTSMSRLLSPSYRACMILCSPCKWIQLIWFLSVVDWIPKFAIHILAKLLAPLKLAINFDFKEERLALSIIFFPPTLLGTLSWGYWETLNFTVNVERCSWCPRQFCSPFLPKRNKDTLMVGMHS